MHLEFSADAVGGTPPLSYNWTFSDGATAEGATVNVSANLPITSAKLTVRDAQGQSYVTSFSVGPDSISCPPMVGNSPDVLALEIGLGIAAAVLLVTFLVVRNRRRPPPKPMEKPS